MRIFINVYREINGAMGSVYASRELADHMAGPTREVCIEVEIGENGAAWVVAKGKGEK